MVVTGSGTVQKNKGLLKVEASYDNLFDTAGVSLGNIEVHAIDTRIDRKGRKVEFNLDAKIVSPEFITVEMPDSIKTSAGEKKFLAHVASQIETALMESIDNTLLMAKLKNLNDGMDIIEPEEFTE